MTDAETRRLVELVYGKEKEAKVLRNMKIGQANAKKEFLKKYPDADVSKFRFEVKLTDEGDIDKYETYFVVTNFDSFDITSDSFKIGNGNGNGNGLLTHLVVVTLIYNVFTNWV